MYPKYCIVLLQKKINNLKKKINMSESIDFVALRMIIFSTGNSLSGNLNLKTLNLSANCIASLKVCVLTLPFCQEIKFKKG